jgi:two-component system chemotaxis response regulator CheY
LTSGGHEVVGEAKMEISAFQSTELKPDIVTMGVVMPKMNGIEAVKAIKIVGGSVKVIMCILFLNTCDWHWIVWCQGEV